MTTKLKTEQIETQTETTTQETTLTPLEEKVLLMRQGAFPPVDLPLTFLGEDNPELAAKLEEIERHAIEAVGARNPAAKRRIISALRTKGN